MSAAVIPKNLTNYLRVITGYHKQLIRFYPDRSGTINSQDILRWTFPREILNIPSLTHFLDFSTSYIGSTSTTVYYQGCYFPRNSASIIDTTTLFINGAVFENIPSYNHLFNVLYDNTTGIDYNQNSLRQLENNDPSMAYTVGSNNETITPSIQGSSATYSADPSDSKKPLQIRNFLGFLGTCKPAVLDLRNVEVILEIRYAVPQIMWKGVVPTGTLTTVTPAFTIDKYYMTIEKISFDDDYYNIALDSLKSTGNYTVVYKTYNLARGPAVTKQSNPTLQFSVTSKYLSKLYLTFVDSSNLTISTLQNTSNTVAWAKQITDPSTYTDAFNQSIYFKKNGVNLTDSQIEINGIPVYPYAQTLAQIKNNNLIALGLDNNVSCAEYNGFFDLTSWSKYGFLQVVNFEHPNSFNDENIITGYPNPNNIQLNLKWSTNWLSTASGSIYMFAYSEKVSQVHFNGSQVTIEF